MTRCYIHPKLIMSKQLLFISKVRDTDGSMKNFQVGDREDLCHVIQSHSLFFSRSSPLEHLEMPIICDAESFFFLSAHSTVFDHCPIPFSLSPSSLNAPISSPLHPFGRPISSHRLTLSLLQLERDATREHL